ncbi:MAG: hypothetical protein A3B37_01775 [Candidatus Sungbacteria bacterium RIFCSPLOWO2_01_FULL_59_16]|uniref:Four helix bundle protein n=1 Tax=Candidatus Sungbacteria bacterium RIFCSPLOWO2_01_FULL_59_16 TaxID=1802280 RepID=A0A1G2LAD9_9BACT|nr:MAG: hypothetical protein A3B37_01775 [Candidatus Sungbacteria bacterium RIFCSPLOWO2_01_FULL_59_16]
MDNQEYKNLLLRRTKKFSIDVINFADDILQRGLSKRIVLSQLIRSATSIGANIIEAQAASSRKDFINFIHYALKSANETCYWLELLKETTRGDPVVVEHLLREATELSKLLGSSVLALKGRK